MYRPWTMRKCGIEFEMRPNGVTMDSLAAAVRLGVRVAGSQDAVVNNGGWGRSSGSSWDVKTDASCGYEIATPAITLDATGHHTTLAAVLRELNLLNPVVDRACGLHVHVDCSDFSWQELQTLIRLWARYEPFFFELVPAARSSNHFCAPLRGGRGAWSAQPVGTVQTAIAAPTEQAFSRYARQLPKYQSLRTNIWWQHGRVEFRLHSGSLDYDKIRQWAMLVLSVVQRVKETSMPAIAVMAAAQSRPVSTSYVLKNLGLLPSSVRQDVPEEAIRLSAWVNTRREQFGPAGVERRRQAARQRAAEQRTNGFSFIRDRSGCQAGVPTACPHPREFGFVLCGQHRIDYEVRNSGGFRHRVEL